MAIKENEREREREFSVLPHSTGILDEPGGEPDGAEQGWGVQGVVGEVLVTAPGLFSV